MTTTTQNGSGIMRFRAELQRGGKTAAGIAVPAEAPDALAARAAGGFFAGLPPSHHGAYVSWIEQAKKPDTRARRVAQTAAMLAEGWRRS
jgi:uncharacterized protein YdeI (YjbR/CyaY-like superfamily)